MSIVESAKEYDLTPGQVEAVKHLSPEQVQYIKGYSGALENVVIRHPRPPLLSKGYLCD